MRRWRACGSYVSAWRRLMNEVREPPQNFSTASPTTIVFVAVAVLQLLMWLFTYTGLDGGFVWGVYSCVLLGYWGVVWLIWALRLARGLSLAWVVALSGSLPPVACGLWLLWLSGFFGD